MLEVQYFPLWFSNSFSTLRGESFNYLEKNPECHYVEFVKTFLVFHRKMERLTHEFGKYQGRWYFTKIKDKEDLCIGKLDL